MGHSALRTYVMGERAFEETAGEDGHGANAVDGDPNTIWHTQWQDDSPPCPHEIIIELVPAATIKGFTYLPRQDEEVNGTINEYEFYVSDDGKDFGAPAIGLLRNTEVLQPSLDLADADDE